MPKWSQLDVTDFKMTRLSDVIDQGLLRGLGNIEISELDESNLEELDHLIEKIQHPLGMKHKDKTHEVNSKLFLEKDEPLKATQVNIQQECTEKVLEEAKYTRDELLMLASSPASKLSPPGWDQVVNQLPSAIINVQEESPIGKGVFAPKSQLIHRAINQEQLRKETNPGEDQGHSIFKASTFPSDTLSKASTATNDSAVTEQAGNKNTFIDNLIHEKLVNRTLDQSHLKVEGSSSTKKNTISHSASSLPCNKPSIPCSKPSIPCSKHSIPCSKHSIPCSKPSIPCSEPSIPCSEPSIACSEPFIPCSEPSIPCSKPSIPCSEPSIPCNEPSIPCSEPSIPCSIPSITCSEPSIPCSEPSIPGSEPFIPCSKSSLPCSKPSLPCSEPSLPCSKSSPPCSKPSIPCSKPSLPCIKPSIPCSKASMACSICKELCKRGVSTPCCNAKACRYCAVKTLTDIYSNVCRKCWNCGKTPVSTLDLIVDYNLREAVQRFNVMEFGKN